MEENQEHKENIVKNKSVETYAEDMARVIEGSGGGLIKKIIHEQEEIEFEKKNSSPKSKKNQLFMIIGIILMITAAGVLVFLFVFNRKVTTVEIAPAYQPPIFVDQNYFAEVAGLNPEEIARSVSNEVQKTDVKAGGIESIYPTENKQAIGFRKFVEDIKGNFDASSSPYLDDNFLMGAWNGQSKDFFILLKVRSFTDVFESLRAWEGKMFSDLHGFFGIDISPDTKYLLTKNFENGIVANKNARILRDQNGNIVLMYVFADDQSVIIANSEAATKEIITRLAAGVVKK